MKCKIDRKYDYSKLEGRIVEVFGTRTAFAAYLGKTKAYVSRYLNEHTEFSQSVMVQWCDALNIDSSQIGDFFLTRRVCN